MKTTAINSLEARIGLILLAALLLPTAFIAWFAYTQLVDTIAADRIKTVGRVADARHEQLVMVFQRAALRSQSFLATAQSRCGKLAAAGDCYQRDLQSFVADEDALGATLAGPGGSRVSVGDAGMLAGGIPALAPGQLAQFTPHAHGAERKYFVSAADPESGRKIAVVYAARQLQPIFDVRPDLGRSGETFLSDGDGFFITSARYTSSQGHSHPISARPMVRCLSPENGETLDVDYRNVPIIHGFRFVPEIGSGCIMAHVDQAEAFAPVARLKFEFLTAMALFAGLAFATARYLGARIALPVKRLAGVARSIAAGDMAARAAPQGYREVADLAAAFNAMTGQLAEVNAGLERRVAERTASLQESEQRFRHLFNAGSDAIFVAERLPDGRPGRLIEVNDIACGRLGYWREELLRMTPDDIDAPGKDRGGQADLLGALAESRQATIERVHLAKDGRRIPVEINLHLLTLDGKEAILGVARDVSERKQAEETLRESHNLLRAVIDTAPLRIFWKDRDSRYLGCNAAFAEDAGVAQPADLIGKTDDDLALARPRRTVSHRGPQGDGNGRIQAVLRRGAGHARWPSGMAAHLESAAAQRQGRRDRGRAGHLRGHHRPQAGRNRRERGQAGGREREPRQERVPRQHEPRNPHPDERHHRAFRTRLAARPAAQAAGLLQQDTGFLAGAAFHPQRHPRLLQDRGRAPGTGRGAIRP